ncbi:MAG: elongation factor P maturation arginine rhamnosyltransferase EarP [Burkholderiales bacterium]|nr:MAG: elongation factor P maturation arginine rhamnosyltransferase EarP [Burkholderiales bacterium]
MDRSARVGVSDSAPEPSRPVRWDLFCRVIDNLGDAGVCWRLARALTAACGDRVRLYIDAPSALVGLAGCDPPHAPGVQVYGWDAPADAAAPIGANAARQPIDAQWAEASIAAFACRPPEAYLQRLARREAPPVRINLEYLSAEEWVGGAHALRSPHPRLALDEFFFFPGFTPATGGLLREPGLLERRDAWQADPGRRASLARELGIPATEMPERWISLFCYAHAELEDWLDALSRGHERLRLLVTEGAAREALAAAGLPRLANGVTVACGQLELTAIPFLVQDRYDELLWSCDLNVVRGEDSFVRAQWAGRPLLWHAYPQAGDAHLPKVRAFALRYLQGLGSAAAGPIGQLLEAWNTGRGIDRRWPAAWREHDAWRQQARAWAQTLAAMPDLVSRLRSFCMDRLDS